METPTRETVRFDSSDGRSQVAGTIWWPATEPVGVVQLVHGMAEYIDRYDHFANRLTKAGFVVCGHDHIGHGRSVMSPDELGHMNARTGCHALVTDTGLMRTLIRERVPRQLPHFLFGHSMGSFVVRAYISTCSQGLSGAIICGTGQVAPVVARAGNALARLVCLTRGQDRVSPLLQELTVGQYSRAFEDALTPLDWLSLNRDNVEAYQKDELCGFPFTAGANAALTELICKASDKRSCEGIDRALPLLYIAGEADPVAGMGKGALAAKAMAEEAGVTDVTCHIYRNMRHEILNEDGRDEVIDDIIQWIEERL